MSALAVVLIVLAVLVLLLFIGGAIASGRRVRATDARLLSHLEEVNKALALARAQDRGWEPATLEAAARAAYATRAPGAEIESLQLVQVVDRPGTDEDVAVFRVAGAGGELELTLGRQQGDWVEIS